MVRHIFVGGKRPKSRTQGLQIPICCLQAGEVESQSFHLSNGSRGCSAALLKLLSAKTLSFCHCPQGLFFLLASKAQVGCSAPAPSCLSPSRHRLVAPTQAVPTHPTPGPSVSICHCCPASWHEDREVGSTWWYLAKRQGSFLVWLRKGKEMADGEESCTCPQALSGCHLPPSAWLWSFLAGCPNAAAQPDGRMAFTDRALGLGFILLINLGF